MSTLRRGAARRPGWLRTRAAASSSTRWAAAIIEGERVAVEAVAGGQREAGGESNPPLKRQTAFIWVAAAERKIRSWHHHQTREGVLHRVVVRDQPVSGIRSFRPVPGGAHHERGDGPAWLEPGLGPMMTLTGMVNSRIIPPSIRPAMESRPVEKTNSSRERHGAQNGEDNDRRPPQSGRKSVRR